MLSFLLIHCSTCIWSSFTLLDFWFVNPGSWWDTHNKRNIFFFLLCNIVFFFYFDWPPLLLTVVEQDRYSLVNVQTLALIYNISSLKCFYKTKVSTATALKFTLDYLAITFYASWLYSCACIQTWLCPQLPGWRLRFGPNTGNTRGVAC